MPIIPMLYLSSTNEEYEYLDYGQYLKGETLIRVCIYTPYISLENYEVIDSKTSIAHLFNVKGLKFILYGNIIGTWGIKYQKELALKELENFKKDIQYLQSIVPNLIIVGDLNTSFIEISTSHYPKNRRKNYIKTGRFYKRTRQKKNIFIKCDVTHICCA